MYATVLSFWNREAIEIEVVNLLEDYYGIVHYPIDIDGVIARVGVQLEPYPETECYERQCSLYASPDAFTMCNTTYEYASIRYNSKAYSPTRIAFSKGHELGHVYLEHTDPDDYRQEEEADYFSGYLFAPHPLIGHYHLESCVASSFNVGTWCADIALKQYKDRCRMGGPIKEHEQRLLSIACIDRDGGGQIG